MYPEMIDASKAEGNRIAERTFTYANELRRFTPGFITICWRAWRVIQESYPFYVCPSAG